MVRMIVSQKVEVETFYTIGFKLAAIAKFDELGSNLARASRECHKNV